MWCLVSQVLVSATEGERKEGREEAPLISFIYLFIFFLFFFQSRRLINKCMTLFLAVLLLVGSWFPDQGLNPGPEQRKWGVLTTGLLGNSPVSE